ncbi:metallophosphoesterase family protein [Thermogladius sp.]|uniref:metallophosphoesterase family protein n=1 Tax=Thermogladius sp. TaxID=2023064 RepID=UPI003D10C50E
MRPEIAALLLLLTLTAAMGVHAEGAQPLQQATSRPLPQNLPYYVLVVWGDNRPSYTSGPYSLVYPTVFVDILNEVSGIYPQAVIGGGDFVSFGTLDQYKAFYNLLSQARIDNFIPVIGNHDVAYGPDSWSYYAAYVGNTTVVFDDIPGWRIASLNAEGSLSDLYYGLNATLSGLGNRSLILAYHRPIYPYVGHNMQDEEPDKASAILNFVSSLTFPPRIVLQSHWHGYAENATPSTLWLVTGGGGAPLYGCSSANATFCSSTYNYVVLVLYPTGEYSYIPLKAGPGSGNVTVRVADSTSFVVNNTKLDVYGNYREVPVRLVWTAGSRVLYLVGFAPANSLSYAAYDESSKAIRTNLTNAYVYVQSLDRPYEATVVEVRAGVADLSALNLSGVTAVSPPLVVQPTQTTTTVRTTTTTTWTTTTTTTSTTTTTTTTTATTTTTVTTSPTATVTTTTTTTATQVSTGSPEETVTRGVVTAVVVLLFVLALTYLYLRRARARK